jgi:hypothetical protein
VTYGVNLLFAVYRASLLSSSAAYYLCRTESLHPQEQNKMYVTCFEMLYFISLYLTYCYKNALLQHWLWKCSLFVKEGDFQLCFDTSQVWFCYVLSKLWRFKDWERERERERGVKDRGRERKKKSRGEGSLQGEGRALFIIITEEGGDQKIFMLCCARSSFS